MQDYITYPYPLTYLCKIILRIPTPLRTYVRLYYATLPPCDNVMYVIYVMYVVYVMYVMYVMYVRYVMYVIVCPVCQKVSWKHVVGHCWELLEGFCISRSVTVTQV